jgi:hypothetical protein
LPFFDGKRCVLIGELDRRVWDEQLSQNFSHRVEDGPIHNPACGDLLLNHLATLLYEAIHATLRALPGS